jgi:hydrogenase nickel incorporation protein HypB
MMSETIRLGVPASAKNDEIAQTNRTVFREAGCTVINMISSPGSGKTSVLEHMGKKWGKKLGVITGDIQTTLDAQRIAAAGAQAVQIETGGACHLTASMIGKALPSLDLVDCEMLVIENVGNLVCPSTYYLGEDCKVAVLSVAEGDEKPAKYPALFVRAHAVIINKVDLLPYVRFDMKRAMDDCRKLNSRVKIFPLSCATGEGMDAWFAYCSELRGR